MEAVLQHMREGIFSSKTSVSPYPRFNGIAIIANTALITYMGAFGTL